MKMKNWILSLAIISGTLQADIPAKKTLSEDTCIKKIYEVLKESTHAEDKESAHNRLKGLVTRHDKSDQPWKLYKKVEDYAKGLGDKAVAKTASGRWRFFLQIELKLIWTQQGEVEAQRNRLEEAKNRLKDAKEQLNEAEQEVIEVQNAFDTTNQELETRRHAVEKFISKHMLSEHLG